MKYERQKIVQSFWEGVTFWKRPELPKIELKKGRTTYKITDLRCLNELAVDTLMDVLRVVCGTPNCEEVSYDVTNVEEDKVNLIADILSSVEWQYKKRGLNAMGLFLVTGSKGTTTKDGKKIITFLLEKENAEAIYNYAQAHKEQKNGVFNFVDLVFAVIDESEKRMKRAKEIDFKKCLGEEAE